MALHNVLQRFLDAETRRGTIAARHIQPASAARYGPWPQCLDAGLAELLRSRGVEQLYLHQAQAIERIEAGHHTVVVTPTASGKTLCYNLPVLQGILQDDTARALYLFPTKALAQDQMAELFELAEGIKARTSLGVFTYDGDTPADARRSIRSKGHIVISNPDMLHTGILPHHTRWGRFFSNLRYIVVDEMHTYRGVFGSHLANLFRRLRRICDFYGSQPRFIFCSATIANPAELAASLIEQEVSLVNESGAPTGEKTLIFYNPPVLNKELGIRRSYLSAARRIAGLFLKADVRTIVFASSRLNVEVLTRYLKDKFERTHAEEGRIRGYRGGYLPGERRSIEKGLREGTVLGVVSTNALELGIDVGTLEAAVLAGYPGTVASTWQQAGRAGRRRDASAVVLVARSDPLDQFLMNHPEFFFGASPEHARINADNLAILVSHVKCAAFELPLEENERFGQAEIGEICRYLAEKGVLHESGGQFHWTQEVYPADTISLRSASPENFVIMDLDHNSRVIAEVDWHSAPSTVYEDAIYMCQGLTYNVKQLDYGQRRAYVRPVSVDYYTDAITSTSVKILDGFQRQESTCEQGSLQAEHGEVHVSWRVSGFKKIKFYSRENVGYGEVHLPDHEMHTTSFWFTLSEPLLLSLGYQRADLLDGVVGLAYCLHHLAPLFLMCDIRDIDRCVGDRAATWFARADRDTRGRYTFAQADEPEPNSENWLRVGMPDQELPALEAGLLGLARFEPTIFLYDNYPSGMGFSAQLFDLFPQLLARGLELLEQCPCEDGCPGCVGPPQEVGNRAREVARAVARLGLQTLGVLEPALA